ncbi:MAG: hypothetical protein KF762_12505 [Acidobacteria bacterium]|nr:hypothetical protein [Acidobacteriota bacterium]
MVIEVEETVVLRSGEITAAVFCPACGEKVAMATPWIASAVSGITEREIFQLIELGMVHSVEHKRLFVCLDSLKKCTGEIWR